MDKKFFFCFYILLLINLFAKAQPTQYDVVIDEIMADPSPQVGLPNYEWIELKNISPSAINLKDWRLKDLASTSGPFAEFILQPDSFLIVCSSTASASLSSFGSTLKVSSFPSLDNDNNIISIVDENGKTIHAISYSSDWYQNELKKDGGWTLEMIDTKNTCGPSNWMASKDKMGGTPGKQNSVDAVNKDEDAPKLLNAFANDRTSITLVFNEPINSLEAANTASFTFDNGLFATAANALPPLFNKVDLKINPPIEDQMIYMVSVKNIADCSGNKISEKNFSRFGVAQDADSFDLVINEILYNPSPMGVDFVELYNRSKKIINLRDIFIANRNSADEISNITQLSKENLLFFPGEMIVVTSDPGSVKSQYITLNPEAFLKIKSLPSFSNDKGNVIVLNHQGIKVDEVDYSEKWHFPLLHNTEGVSLERIDYNSPSLESNFHSAAASVGFATPGYKNSQLKLVNELPGEITISPEIFSPDNDGNNDFATINYNFPSPGYVANVTIFDASGRPVRYLQKNSLTGTEGFFHWNGLGEKNNKLPQGIYIIYTEIFNKEGRVKHFKNTIVLARRNR